ncbi:ribonuclease H family protein [Levilactobacillus lindianensis]|uniref:ribonuclease H family protein n=1 Tax=Levilactobacillus lindianensis TaxID=2486018 RepID=UPI000F74B05D|nr:ribonuclease H family protein [Levilactobacillus lindianensis]
MAQKYYAVRKGKKPGIYRTWPETQRQVNGFSGAQYKSFGTAAEAQAFMTGQAEAKSTTKRRQATPTSAAPIDADITVYTDGGSRNTGNVAGGHVRAEDKAAWAYRIELPDRVEKGSDGEFGATNNRMEIMAFQNALQHLVDLGVTDQKICFVLDSRYVLNAVTQGWLAGWKRRGWKRSAGPLANAELWQEVDRLLPQFAHLSYQWTKGHATNQGNVFVDHLLNETMDRMSAGNQTQIKAPATPTTKTSATPKHGQTMAQSVADLSRSLQDFPFLDN